MPIIDLANPTRFLNFAERVLPWLAAATVLGLALGLSQAYSAPDDYQQGATVKIMFIHVPSAWLAMFCWGVMSVAALGTLVWRHPLADVAAKSAAPIGAAFTLLCLVTGSLWGRPMWNTYWVWDGRLTSMLVLFLMYLGVITLWRTVEEPSRASRAAAILILVGAINLPIIKFSVECWHSLHQPASVLRLSPTATSFVCPLLGSPSRSNVMNPSTDKSGLPQEPQISGIDRSILRPLLFMAAAFTLFFLTLQLAAMRNEILRRRVRTLRLMQAQRAPGS
jgi:heme exporter protein C